MGYGVHATLPSDLESVEFEYAPPRVTKRIERARDKVDDFDTSLEDDLEAMQGKAENWIQSGDLREQENGRTLQAIISECWATQAAAGNEDQILAFGNGLGNRRRDKSLTQQEKERHNGDT